MVEIRHLLVDQHISINLGFLLDLFDYDTDCKLNLIDDDFRGILWSLSDGSPATRRLAPDSAADADRAGFDFAASKTRTLRLFANIIVAFSTVDVGLVLGNCSLLTVALVELKLVPIKDRERFFRREDAIIDVFHSFNIDYDTYGLDQAGVDPRAGVDFSASVAVKYKVFSCVLSVFEG